MSAPTPTPVLPATAAPGGRAYKWAVVAMLWFVCFFNYADRQAIFSVFPVLKREMSLSDVQLGLIGSAFMWVYALALPLAGLIGDRVSRKWLIVGGLLFWSAVTVCTAVSQGFGQLVFFRALEGLGEAFYFPAAMSLVSDYHGPATRSRAMAVCQSSVYAGTIGGGTVAGFLAEGHGWRAGFYLFGTLGIVLGAALVFGLREPARGRTEPTGTATDEPDAAPPRPARWAVPLLIATFMAANFVAAIFLTWMPSYLSATFHMSLSMAGLNGTAYIQIASVLGVITGGVLADALARRSAAGRMVTQLIGLAVGVPFIFLTGYARATPLLVLAMVGFGFFKGLYDANLWASLYEVVPVNRRGTALGVMNSLGWVGGGIAPVAIAAAAHRFGFSVCLSATSAVYAVAAVLMLAALILRRRSGPTDV